MHSKMSASYMQTPTGVLRHFPVIETKITTAQTRGL